MSYRVKLHPKVERFLTKLPEQVEARIRAKLQLLKEEPYRYLEHYEGDYHKLRIGDYRALIDIEKKKVLVRVLDHRSRIYKR